MTRPILLITGILLCLSSHSQVQINGSYLNVSRPSGGPVAPGDILELHAVISVTSTTSISSLYYTDNIPAGTSFVSGSLKVATNENKVVSGIPNTGTYSDAADADRGKIVGSAITIYMGNNATSSAGGSITGNSTKPTFQKNTSILMAAYQVKVTADFGSSVTTGGTFHYKDSRNNPVTTNVAVNTLVVSPFYSCQTPGTTNYITQESGGSFSTGNVTNRSTQSNNVTGYQFTTLTTSKPADAQYSIVNNTSPSVYTGSNPAGSDRVFSVWDIIGDHTDAANPAAGNAPTVKKRTGGYLLAVNATYTPAIVFTTNIIGLLPNSTYTVSLWVRNICPQCGNDPATGNATTTAGVKPNLAINLNGKNYYSSGDITYSGQWVQKSFTFQNGNSTTATLDIKNNAPGGGGNDWGLDDISMTQCIIVLPVQLRSFTGHSSTQGNVLDYELDPQPELSSFVVERSTDGIRFQGIGEVAASADSSHYAFIDQLLPSPGIPLYYRIKMVNRDGTTTYSTIIVLRTAGNFGSLTTHLAPNPTRSSTTLVIGSATAVSARVVLLDPAGSLLYSRSIMLVAGANTVPLTLPSRLPAGIYIVRTTTPNESAINRLLVE